MGKVLLSGNLSLLPRAMGLQPCPQQGREQAPGPQQASGTPASLPSAFSFPRLPIYAFSIFFFFLIH